MSLQELIYQDPREHLTNALVALKSAIPELSDVMQEYIRNSESAKVGL